MVISQHEGGREFRLHLSAVNMGQSNQLIERVSINEMKQAGISAPKTLTHAIVSDSIGKPTAISDCSEYNH